MWNRWSKGPSSHRNYLLYRQILRSATSERDRNGTFRSTTRRDWEKSLLQLQADSWGIRRPCWLVKTDHNNGDVDKHTERTFILQTPCSAIGHIAFLPRQMYLPTKGTLGLVGEEDSQWKSSISGWCASEQLSDSVENKQLGGSGRMSETLQCLLIAPGEREAETLSSLNGKKGLGFDESLPPRGALGQRWREDKQTVWRFKAEISVIYFPPTLHIQQLSV